MDPLGDPEKPVNATRFTLNKAYKLFGELDHPDYSINKLMIEQCF